MRAWAAGLTGVRGQEGVGWRTLGSGVEREPLAWTLGGDRRPRGGAGQGGAG